MKIELTPAEARVIGCLLEKQATTPDQYPLSLNALTNACNQKSNRDPLMALTDAEVQVVVDGLVRKSLVMEKSGFGSRVPKYQQRFCNLEFSGLKFTPLEQAIVCELLLRGPQTPGELRTRAGRMAPVRDVAEVEGALASLAARSPQPLVRQLPRAAGQRDARWTHLFTAGDANTTAAAAGPFPAQPSLLPGSDVSVAPPAVRPSSQAPAESPAAAPASDDRGERLARLEAEVRQLRTELEALRQTIVGEPGN